MPPEYFYPLLGTFFALAWGVIGTVRWLAKEKFRSSARGGLDSEEAERLRALEGRVGELEERSDFVERVLADRRREGLPSGARDG